MHASIILDLLENFLNYLFTKRIVWVYYIAVANHRRERDNLMANKKFNVYQAVTDRIIAQLEEGVIPWHKPWSSVTDGAHNRVSKKPYSLINQMLLMHDGEYATYKQWQDIGGKVRKGEKSEIVVFWKMLDITEEIDGEVVKKRIPILKYYNVFHVSQVDGVEPKSIESMVEHEYLEEAENVRKTYIDREGIRIIEEVSDSAFYSPTYDYINIPAIGQFDDVNEFYSTMFHEMIHSTGHESRLGRFAEVDKLAPFGSADYSKEELVAELGSAMLMNTIGIETEKVMRNNAAYIQGWLKVLKDDSKMIVSAASRAEKACKYILGEEIAKAA